MMENYKTITWRWKPYKVGGETRRHLGRYGVSDDGRLIWIKWDSKYDRAAAKVADRFPPMDDNPC